MGRRKHLSSRGSGGCAYARESREHLDGKQKPKINDPFTQNADMWREQGREEKSEPGCDKRDSECAK